MGYGMTDDQVAIARQVMALPGLRWAKWMVLLGEDGRRYVVVGVLDDGRPIVARSGFAPDGLAPAGAILDVTDPGNAARLMEMAGGDWSCESTAGGGRHASIAMPGYFDPDNTIEASAPTLCEAVCRVLIRRGWVA